MQHRFTVTTCVLLAVLLVISVGCSGGGNNNQTSNTPSITSLSLTSATVGSGDTTITVTGTNFTSASIAVWASSNLATTFVSSTQLTVVIPAANLATAGTFSITVRNSDTNKTSNPVTFTVSASGPAISALTPSSTTAGAPGFTLRVSGNNFTNQSTVRWGSTDLTTSFLSTSQLAATVPATLVASSGSVNITVNTPGAGGGTSSPQPFNVNAPLPAITGLNPSNVTAGLPGITLTVNGTNFVANSTVRIGTTDKTTTFVSPNQLIAAIPAADIASAGSVGITVNNPAPGGGVSNTANITVSAATGNRAPVANAGAAQTVAVGSTVHLDGSRSSDADGNTLTYTWNLIARPATSTATLSSASAVQPTFVADVAGTYQAQLVVNDGTTSSAASVVTITTTNSAPVANAGRDQTVLFGATVQLDGTGSTDVDGNLVTYSWTLISSPSGSGATLTNPNTSRPTFIIDRPGNYVAQLVVNDGSVSSAPSTVTISTVNSAPVANAGVSKTVAVGATVHLDGSGSGDADGDSLTYRWAILSAPSASAAAVATPTEPRSSFVADRAGLYVVQLIVNDGIADSAASIITVSTVNTPPNSNAGFDQSITPGGVVQLDGSASTDADGNRVTYRWALVSRPTGSTASVINANSVRASFNADIAGIYVAQLIVNDGQVDSAPSVVRFGTVNNRPVAHAGTAQKVSAGDTVQLDGSGSTDAEGDALTYRWALLKRPATSLSFLSTPNTPNPVFVADKAGDYVLQLIVSDNKFTSVPATVTISSAEVTPIADAGAGRTVAVGNVQLDGTGSSDPGGAALSYAWSLISAPAGSAAALIGGNTSTPAFTADVAGEYVAQLVVGNGTLSSAPATVRISTVSSRPIANAGTPQLVFVGSNVTLDGSSSNSPDGLALSHKWSLLTIPQGSAAALSNPAALSPSITIDKRGVYVAQLIVGDGVYSSTPSTVAVVTNDRPPVANAGSNQTVPVGTTVTIDGTGSTSPDGYPLTYQWSFTSLPNGSNPTLTGASKVTFIPDAVGTYVVQLIVSDGLTSAPVTVSITTTPNKTISFTPSPLAMNANETLNLTLTLGQAAPTGGLTVNLTSSDTNIATVPSTVTVSAGATTAIVAVTSKSTAGTAKITGKATDFTDGTVDVNVSARTLTFETLTVGKDLQVATHLTLSVAAPSAGVDLTVTSPDTSKVLLSTAAGTVGTGSVTLKVTGGALSSPQFYVQAKAGSGTVTLTAKGSGYTDSTKDVTLAPSGFFVTNVTNDVLNTTTLAADTNINVASGALDPTTKAPLAIQQTRAGLGTVNVSIDVPNTTIGTITTNPVVFKTNDALKPTAFHPLAVGTMNLTVTPPTGFTAPTQHQVIATTVSSPVINIGNISVGKDLQVQDGAWLETGAPTGGVDITFTSSDPSKVLLSTSPTTAGSSSITMHYPAGFTAQLYFYVQALANSGSVTITAKGDKYADSTGTITLLPSGFVISSSDITNAVVGGANVPVGLASAALQTGTLQFASYQQLRGGISAINVPVNSSNPAVGTITTTPVPFTAGDQAKSTAFHPLSAGNSTISIGTPAGFSTPAQFQSISATVQPAGINAQSDVNTGKDLITSASFSLGTVPAAPVTATVTSMNPGIATVSTSASTAGTSSISFPNITTQAPTYFVQGISVGTTTLTIQAPGYADASVTVTVYPSGFIVTKSSLGVTVGSDTPVSINPAVLLPGSLDVFDLLPLRPGVTVQVGITSSDTAVGTVVTPVAVTGASGTTTFHAIASGTTNLTLVTPAGFSTPNAGQQVTVTVAGITTASSVTTGKDLMTFSTFALNTPPASAVTVTVTSNTPSVATVSTSASTAGTNSVTYSNVSTTSASTFFVHGLATGTATFTISAPGYPDATVTVNVNPSGFILTKTDFTTSVSSDTPISVAPAVLVPNTLVVFAQQQLRPGVTVQVPITSSSPAIGTVTSPISVTSGSGSTTFHAVAKGTTNLTLSTPSGYSTPTSLQAITATVQ